MALTPRQAATDTVELGNQVGTALLNAITAQLPSDAELLTVHAYRIFRCNSHNNLWFGHDLHNADGEAFDGSGRFWQCGSKLCQHCVSKTSRRNRKILTAIIDRQKLTVGEHFHFLTLTMPNNGLPLLTARRIMNYAWTLFRKKTWFKRTFTGGVKSEEFTLTKRGYHYHMHLIIRGRFVNYSSMRHYWTEALKVAHERLGHPISFATSDGLAIANIAKIGSISNAVKEVAKYITKNSSWLKLKHEDLLDAARIERWPRMFEFFGSFRILNGVANLEESESSANKTILDTKSLSDEEVSHSWRKTVAAIGASKYIANLDQQIIEISLFRQQQLRHHFGAAQFSRMKYRKQVETDTIIDTLTAIVIRRDGEVRPNYHARTNKHGGLINAMSGNVIHLTDEKRPSANQLISHP